MFDIKIVLFVLSQSILKRVIIFLFKDGGPRAFFNTVSVLFYIVDKPPDKENRYNGT